jgi:hypothetical protein
MNNTLSILCLATVTLAVGCAGKASPGAAAEPVALTPAVWAPKRIYAPLDGLTRSSAERVLAAEAGKDCGGQFESRSFVAETRPGEPGSVPAPMLAIEYVCVTASTAQSLGIEAPIGPALQ